MFPLVGTWGHEWVSELMGSSLTSQLDELQVLAVRKVSGVLRCPSSVWRFLSLELKIEKSLLFLLRQLGLGFVN